MTGKSILPLIFLIYAVGFYGCSSGGGSVVVLLPDADGRVGKIQVSNSKGSVLMDKKNEAVSLKSELKPKSSGIMPEKQIKTIFKAALTAQPILPARFFLNFYLGSDEIVPESVPVLQIILADIRKRPSPHITVRGHADRRGTKTINYKLSEKRAKKVKDLLEKEGVFPESIEITSHGEDLPLIQTADEVSKLLNRRVEVIVR
ncbi:MAG: OmpA family protein [Proteobacteria bacterium]|nr:OmpA family protein [Pseudomonadota bacterium]MBU1583474.1 OmpA family protein [Pseudomonadota bacterium]